MAHLDHVYDGALSYSLVSELVGELYVVVMASFPADLVSDGASHRQDHLLGSTEVIPAAAD